MAGGYCYLPSEEQVKTFGALYSKGLRLAAEKLDKVRSAAQQAIASLIEDPFSPFDFRGCSTSSQEYFHYLLDMQATKKTHLLFPYQREWFLEMLEGYVGSADTGSEELVRNSRAALAAYCESGNTDLVCQTLVDMLRKNVTNDRILVPTMEVLNFLFDARIIQHCSTISFKSLYILTRKAHYKTSNVRKLDAAIHLYGGLIEGE